MLESAPGDQKTIAGAALERPAPRGLPVVAIGASAGGLAALVQFCEALPSETGMAFVLVVHLHPSAGGYLATALARHTAKPIVEVVRPTPIAPDHIYVIAPDRTLTLRNGVLQAGRRSEPAGSHRPIDAFFRSLAEDKGDLAIAIVLSGAGNDGALGLQAIKENIGTILAQEPASAEYDSMPRSAIATGLVDHVLLPEAMPGALLRYAQRLSFAPAGTAELEGRDESLLALLNLLREPTHRDYSGYRKSSLWRRIHRRLRLRGIDELPDYQQKLAEDPRELQALVDDLMISVTHFFRDAEAWAALEQSVILPLVEAREAEGSIRVWVPGCATGEEAYSIGMLLLEQRRARQRWFDIRIFATDVAERALSVGRLGRYPEHAVATLPPGRVDAFFDRDDGHVQVKKELRELIVFAPHDLMRDPPLSRLDLVSCRNLLIYLKPEVQHRIIGCFHFASRDGGYLFLGGAETIGSHQDLFLTVSKKNRLYRRLGPIRYDLVDFPGSAGEGKASRTPTATARPLARPAAIAAVARDALLERYAPAAVMIDQAGQVLYFHGQTDNFLAQPPGEPTRDLLAMARRGMLRPLRTAIRQAIDGSTGVTVQGRLRRDRRFIPVRITAAPLAAGRAGGLLLVSFADLVESGEASLPSAAPPDQLAHEQDLEFEEEIRLLRAELRAASEHATTANEELKISNEEIVSANEELQSMNEELETSKEELQALNEELVTVNAELHGKVEELEKKTSDLNNLLNGTEIATLFLDGNLLIRWFTPAMRAFIHVSAADVGRPCSDFALKFADAEFLADVAWVQRAQEPVQREVCGAAGRWYLRRVLPYRSADQRVDGVVATFIDISDRRQAEEEARAATSYAQSIVDTVRDPLLVLDDDLRLISANPAFFQGFGLSPSGSVGRQLDELGRGQWDLAPLRHLLTDTLAGQREVKDVELEFPTEGAGRRTLLLSARRVDHPRLALVLLAIQDITARREAEQRIRQLALFDHLTGLPNRALFRDRLIHGLAQARRAERHLGIILVDLDGFKDVNDTFGHPTGDAILRDAARRLAASARESDTVARLGGDEFVIMLGDLIDPAAAGIVADKVVAALRRPFIYDGEEIRVGASAGLAVVAPTGQRANYDTLLKQVDLALYRAKTAGGNTFASYVPEMAAAFTARKLLEKELRSALERGEFELQFQPEVSLKDGRLAGMEVLLRWCHSSRGRLLPADFLEVAEASKLIVPLGAWVLSATCSQIRLWRADGLVVPMAAVNLSPAQCRFGGLDILVEDLLRANELDPERLELEVTEQLFLLPSDDDCLGSLSRLHERGIAIAVDDFGTGYSSLGQLRRLPVDKVKIDRSFIAGLAHDKDARAIVRAAIALGKALDLRVVAEGIETLDQLVLLRAEGCDMGQGWLLGRPAPAAIFAACLAPDWRAAVDTAG